MRPRSGMLAPMSKRLAGSPKKRGGKKRSKTARVVNAIGLTLVVLFVVAVVWAIFSPEAGRNRNAAPRSSSPAAPPATPASGETTLAPLPSRTGAPWEYDAEANAHWDPRQGHQHWHRGQPPPVDQRMQLMTQQ